jgi:hypothetical protein
VGDVADVHGLDAPVGGQGALEEEEFRLDVEVDVGGEHAAEAQHHPVQCR